MPAQTSNGTASAGIRAARPSLAVDGQDKPDLAQGLIELLIHENTDGLYRCEVTFGNWGTVNNRIDFLYFDRAVLDFGKSLAVKLGTDTIFDGRIMALQAIFPEGKPPCLAVLAEDRLQDLRMTRRTRTFNDVSDADIANQLAGDHGLTPSIDADGPTHKVLAQVNRSDLAFLRDRARSIDAELWIDGRTLHMQAHSRRTGTAVQLAYGKELHSFSALADLAHQRSSVTVSGWDVQAKTGLHEDADDSIMRAELGSDLSGAATLQSSLGLRKEMLAHTVPVTSDEARATAEAHYKSIARRFVVGHGVADTAANLRVGASVDLRGLGPLFSGTYYLSEVRTRFDGVHGLRSELLAERPGLGHAA
jgi:uncharacterized protein